MTAREKFNQRARLQKIKQMEAGKKHRESVKAPEGWIPVRDFCKVRGISESGLFAAIKKGKVRSMKCGQFRYVLPADYEEYVKALREHRVANINKVRKLAKEATHDQQ